MSRRTSRPPRIHRRPRWMRLGDALAEAVVYAMLLIAMVSFGGVSPAAKAWLMWGGGLLGAWAAVGLAVGRWSRDGSWSERLAAAAVCWPVLWIGLQNIRLPAATVLSGSAYRAEIWGAVEAASADLPARLPLAIVPFAANETLRLAIAFAGFFLAVLLLARHRGPALRLTIALTAAALFQGLWGALQFILSDAVRASGALVNPNHYAALLLLCLPAAAALIAVWNRRRPDHDEFWTGRHPAMLLGILVLLALVGWVLSLSRASILLGGSVLLAWGVLEALIHWTRNRGGHRPARLGPRAVVGIVVAGGLIVLLISAAALSQFSLRFSSTDVGTDDRYGYWAATMDGWRQAPLIGLGPGGIEAALNRYSRRPLDLVPVHSHNDYLEILAEWGVVGAGVWALLVVGALVAAARDWRKDLAGLSPSRWIIRRAAAAALLATAAHELLDFPLRVPLVMLCFLIAVSLAIGRGPLYVLARRR
ncbi:O-antigen ligase family protein [bacterium]|nr:O-antigen ligase family protein [bacterium]